jgi:hypothetical protein
MGGRRRKGSTQSEKRMANSLGEEFNRQELQIARLLPGLIKSLRAYSSGLG